MNCRRVSSLLSAYIDGELTGAEMLAIRGHVSTCSECAAECESIRSTKYLIARLRTAVPRDGICDAVMQKLSHTQVKPMTRWLGELMAFPRFRITGLGMSATVCGLAIVLLVMGVVQIYDDVPVSSNLPVYTASTFGDYSAGYVPRISGITDESPFGGRTIHGNGVATAAFPIVSVGLGD